jgi:ubiquinone/menaquinone biosynthesis C-methylase UbiE
MKDEISILGSRLARIRRFAAPVEPGCNVLEIGFMTGGYSIDAWDRLGFRITGIDNAYDGTASQPTIYKHISERLGTHPTFVFGDVTKPTVLKDNSFDLVYSVSVLEHISDVSAAFKEFRRLLRPGGLMVHCWNPYFSPNGGHPWGLLDAPWGHLRIPPTDLDQYLDELRPHEAPVSRPWVWNTLDRKTTLAKMQETVIECGFRLLLWDQVPDAPEVLGDLTPEVFAACKRSYPHIMLMDLTTRDAMLIARKE